MTKRELLQMALDALLFIPEEYRMPQQTTVIRVIEAELAKPEPEPVAYVWRYVGEDRYVALVGSRIARSKKEMNWENNPYPDTWAPDEPLYKKEDL